MLLVVGRKINLSNVGDYEKANFLVHSSAIVGGQQNLLRTQFGFIGGGKLNSIYEGSLSNKALYNSILGGLSNVITGDTQGSVILGGKFNRLQGRNAIAGGQYSSGVGEFSLALGSYSASAHDGAMVLSDSLVPSAENGTIEKRSIGEDTLNLFFQFESVVCTLTE